MGNYIRQINCGCVLIVLLLSALQASAQLNTLSALYFQNQYLGNPAMAGTEKGLAFNLAVRLQGVNIPGAPKTQSFTAGYGTQKNVGLGLNVYMDEAGLIRRTRVMGTYAYHLPLNQETQKLRLGISFGFMNQRIMNEQINGDQNDVSVPRFNKRETYMDGDFGAAFTSSRLSLQAAIPNLKRFLKKEAIDMGIDRFTFFSAASYRFHFSQALDGLDIEPKVAFRGIHGFDNLLDVGTNFSVSNKAASIMAVYHSSQSATFGMGVKIKSLN